MIARATLEDVFRDAVAACDPAARVREAMQRPELAVRLANRAVIGIAIGKAALAMARGAGPVVRGVAVTPADDGVALPPGWRALGSAHPEPDRRSLAAADAIADLVVNAAPDAIVLVLLSGGASSLVELPAPGIWLDDLRTVVRALMASGAPIEELNAVRGALSWVKAGRLAQLSPAPMITLAISDVVGDDLAVIGSGPTVGPWLATPGAPVELGAVRQQQRDRARGILEERGIEPPPAVRELLATAVMPQLVVRDDRAELIAPLAAFGEAAEAALVRRGLAGRRLAEPLTGDVRAVADRIAAEPGLVIAWGEPTLRLPAQPGEGGRAQQLALELARRLRGTDRCALVAGSDGVDGPVPAARPAPAGAFVDGSTWDKLAAAGLDPDAALARCDAGQALAAAGALVVTGPTGINHADLVIVG